MTERIRDVGQNIKGFLTDHKKLSIVAGIIILAVLLFGGSKIFLFGGWIKGGENTNAPFRCRLRAGSTVEVRVSTEKLDKDGFTVLTDDSDRLQTKSKGKKGSELTYYITVSDGTERASWSLGYYASDEARENDERSYVLDVNIEKNEKGKYTVSASAGEQNAVETVASDSGEFRYQILADHAEIELVKPENTLWNAEYDNQVLSVDDLFADGGKSTATVRSVASGDWETTLTFYSAYTNSEGTEIRNAEIKLHLKGSDSTITEVSNEE